MTDLTPETLDAWRWERANAQTPYTDFNFGQALSGPNRRHFEVTDEYRRLVREDVRPAVEPDQDVIDMRAVWAALLADSSHSILGLPGTFIDAERAIAGLGDNTSVFLAAKSALTAIKDRVRRELLDEIDAAHRAMSPFYAKNQDEARIVAEIAAKFSAVIKRARDSKGHIKEAL